MDQAKTCLPYLSGIRGWDAMRLKQKLIGVIVHGVGLFLYRSFENVPPDTNLMIEVLMRTLSKLARLPPICFLQVDGGPENRSNIAYGMDAVLLGKGIFEQVGGKREERNFFCKKVLLPLRSHVAFVWLANAKCKRNRSCTHDWPRATLTRQDDVPLHYSVLHIPLKTERKSELVSAPEFRTIVPQNTGYRSSLLRHLARHPQTCAIVASLLLPIKIGVSFSCTSEYHNALHIDLPGLQIRRTSFVQPTFGPSWSLWAPRARCAGRT
jgi:hypothetical protein